MDSLDAPNERRKCYTARTADPPPPPEREPWRCRHCQTFMYNRDEKGNPAPGAPTPKWGGPSYPELCSVCFEMKMVVDSGIYWKNLHEAWKKGSQKWILSTRFMKMVIWIFES